MLSQTDFLKCYESAKEGDPESERVIYEGYVGFAYRLAKRYCPNDDDAADVAQEAMITAFEKIENYNPTKGNFKSWLAKITVNKALRWNSKVRLFIPLEEWTHLEQVLRNEHDSIEKAEEIIKTLSEEQRKLYDLFFELGLSHAEISEVLKITVANSRVKVFRLLKDLKERFK
ncbi:sigma-70 family RNA polymerase sigma factor [Schleiferiaceae bacterium]|nr:sigma-70 family RNA polymerase sigma factor [Schleiferiaceae bacterium]